MKKEQLNLIIGIATPLLLVTVLLIQLHQGQQNLTRAIIQLHTGRSASPSEQLEDDSPEEAPPKQEQSVSEPPKKPSAPKATTSKPSPAAVTPPVKPNPNSVAQATPPPTTPNPRAGLAPIPGELIEDSRSTNVPNIENLRLTYHAVSMPVIINQIYPRLQNFGSWFLHPRHGRVWMPHASRRNAKWRPYGDKGQWHYTQNGWHWQSDYKWGGTTFHHGRWFWDPDQNGWAWVPGQDWSPAWVTWRESGDRIGWAPMPPTAIASSRSSGSSRVHIDYQLDNNHYAFVPKVDFLSPNPVDFALNETDALAAFQSSRLRDRFRINNQNQRINLGISRREMAQAIGSPIETYYVDFRQPYQPRVVTLEELEAAAKAHQQAEEANRAELLTQSDNSFNSLSRGSANAGWLGGQYVNPGYAGGAGRFPGNTVSPNPIVIDGSTDTTNRRAGQQATNAGGRGIRRGQARPNLSVRMPPSGK